MRPRLLLVALALAAALALPPFATAQPTVWESRGIGGGGALFAPSLSPHAPAELYVSCDMSELFHSTDFGASWTHAHYRDFQASGGSRVQFTEDPDVLYALDYSSVDWLDTRRPVKSVDGGLTWTVLPGDPTFQDAWSVWADPADGRRVIVTDYGNLYYSADGGDTFQQRFDDTSGGGCAVAGVFWDGQSIFVGTNVGLLVSLDGGASFSLANAPALPGGRGMTGFAGAREGGVVRFVCVTQDAGDIYADMQGSERSGYLGVYVLDWGAAAWTQRTNGIAASAELFFAGMATNDVDTLYVAGGDAGTSFPLVYKSIDGGLTWLSVLQTADNQNVATGWAGNGGDHDWWFPETALGFAVSPVDSSRAVLTDFSCVHVTADAGASWRQAYLDGATENPPGSRTPRGRGYRGSGLQNTTNWHLAWADSSTLLGCFSDIGGIRSTDGGTTWAFDEPGVNSRYHVEVAPNGTLYAALGSVHDMYQSTYLQDFRIDGGTGRVVTSADRGRTWQLVHDFNDTVVWLDLDPRDPDTLYASVVNSIIGGIYVTHDASLGAASTWSRLTPPPRTQGHPLSIRVLRDGTLAVTYSGRRDAAGAFTASSGVFVSLDGGATWLDRSDPAMRYWTKDLVVDPHDPAQDTWYVGVWSGWGGPPNDLGGLFRSRDRGQTWTRLNAFQRVTSLTVDPTAADQAYLTTETEGLWFTSDLNAAAPAFARTTYPFRQPERVFFNPHDPSQVWVTSFGNGLRVGVPDVAGRNLLRNAEVTSLSPLAPDLSLVLPLDPRGAPLGDLHQAGFQPGDFDPDATVVGDPSRPLVFYEIEGAATIRLAKTPTRRIRIDF